MLTKIWQTVYWQDNNDERKEDQKSWAADWKTGTALRGGARVAEPINKDKAWNWEENNRKSFTMHLFDSDSTTTSLGGTYSPLNHALKTETGLESDISRVVTAVNLMDNDKYGFNNYNAFCIKETTPSKKHLWGKYYTTGACTVKFDNGAAAAKMARGEKPTEKEMFNIISK